MCQIENEFPSLLGQTMKYYFDQPPHLISIRKIRKIRKTKKMGHES